jgi:hypothetical protein
VIPGLSHRPLRFTADGRGLFVETPSQEILAYDLATGATARAPVQIPPELAALDLSSVFLSRDGRTLFFGVERIVSSQLLVLSGVDGT